MILRQEYAKAVMMGMMARQAPAYYSTMAISAFEIADAMIQYEKDNPSAEDVARMDQKRALFNSA